MLYLAKSGQLEIDEIALEIPILIVMAKVILVLGFSKLKYGGRKIKFDIAATTFNMIGRQICLSNRIAPGKLISSQKMTVGTKNISPSIVTGSSIDECSTLK